MFKKLSKFLQEVRQEMAKVSWPTMDELKGTTVVVIVITIILSSFILGIDKILQSLLNLIY